MHIICGLNLLFKVEKSLSAAFFSLLSVEILLVTCCNAPADLLLYAVPFWIAYYALGVALAANLTAIVRVVRSKHLGLEVLLLVVIHARARSEQLPA